MISKFYIENFRSIEKAEIDLGKITVLTGANSSGKTSVIYAMMVFKNFLQNPNQSIDNILAPVQVNLGGFKETVFKKNDSLKIKLGYEFNAWHKENEQFYRCRYQLELGKTGCSVSIYSYEPYAFELKMDIALPYPLNKEEAFNINIKGVPVEIIWNGAEASSVEESTNKDIFSSQNKKLPDNALNIIRQIIFTAKIGFLVDSVPVRRGFTKPFFNTVPLTTQQYSEDEIATVLATNRDLEGKVSSYLEQFVDKSFMVRPTPGTSNFYLQVRDRQTGFITDLVNEGLGLNQLVNILAKILKQHDTIGLLCIDEPEIHLHPSYIDKLVNILIETSGSSYFNEFLLSSHSEHLIASLLNKVAEGKLNKDDLKIYYLTKDGLKTKFELQPVNEKGQIEGGLKSFYESELNLAKDFFKTND